MKLENWGLIDYESSTARQLEYVDQVSLGAEEKVNLCSHPPVVTLGRGTTPDDLIGWSGSLIETSRGGRATYHGPSQLVIYPILNLKSAHASFAERDIHAYLRALEVATVSCLRETGLQQAEARTSQVGEISLTGVWVGEKKIASIGIAVRKWVTYHGVAINLSEDPLAFSGIRPCGFKPGVMTSVEAELGSPVDRENVINLYGQIFMHTLHP